MLNNLETTNFSFNEAKAINQTINNIYSCVSEGNDLQSLSDFSTRFLNDISQQVDFDKGNIMFYTYSPQIHAYEVSSFYQIGWNENDVNSYINQYCHIDDVLPILSARREIAFLNGNIFSFREQTQYYKEFVEPAQIVNSIDANILLPENHEINAILGFFRDAGKIGFSQKDFEIIKTFQPHLSNALTQYMNLKQQVTDDLFEIFSDIETIYICVLNDDLKLMTYNSAFRNQVASLGSSSVEDNALTRQLQELCSNLKVNVLKNGPQKYGPVSMQLSGHTYPVEIVYTKRAGRTGKFVCLLLTDNFSLKLNKLQSSYGLSERECEILNLILKKGLSNEEISSCLYISISTVKKHLTSAYQKIGVNNQKQLNSLFRRL